MNVSVLATNCARTWQAEGSAAGAMRVRASSTDRSHAGRWWQARPTRVRQRHDPELVGGDDVRDDVAHVPLGATSPGLPLRLGEHDERIPKTVPVPEPRFDRVAQFGRNMTATPS